MCPHCSNTSRGSAVSHKERQVERIGHRDRGMRLTRFDMDGAEEGQSEARVDIQQSTVPRSKREVASTR
jgi:hypothetical protein